MSTKSGPGGDDVGTVVRFGDAGFENYFKEIEPFFPEGAPPDLDAMAETNAGHDN